MCSEQTVDSTHVVPDPVSFRRPGEALVDQLADRSYNRSDCISDLDPIPIRPKTRCQIPATTTEAKLEFNIKSLLSDAAVQAAVGTRNALPALHRQARRWNRSSAHRRRSIRPLPCRCQPNLRVIAGARADVETHWFSVFVFCCETCD